MTTKNGCEECGQLSPFHAQTCKRLPPREDLIAALREQLLEARQKLETASRERDRLDDVSYALSVRCDSYLERARAAELQNGRLKAMLNDIRGMILRARTVHEISELARDIMRRIEGAPEGDSVTRFHEPKGKDIFGMLADNPARTAEIDHQRGVCDEKTCTHCDAFRRREADEKPGSEKAGHPQECEHDWVICDEEGSAMEPVERCRKCPAVRP